MVVSTLAQSVTATPFRPFLTGLALASSSGDTRRPADTAYRCHLPPFPFPFSFSLSSLWDSHDRLLADSAVRPYNPRYIPPNPLSLSTSSTGPPYRGAGGPRTPRRVLRPIRPVPESGPLLFPRSALHYTGGKTTNKISPCHLHNNRSRFKFLKTCLQQCFESTRSCAP